MIPEDNSPMKSHFSIILASTLCVTLGCAGSRAPSPRGASTKPVTALDLLALRKPGAEWEKKSLLEADLDQDGRKDYVLLGRHKGDFVVGIVKGPVRADSQTWMLDFPSHGGEDALCSKHVKMALESLADSENQGPEADQPRKGQGINLSDDLCDAFHIYWSPRKQDFAWWRL
jgi:hypothetical protein